MARCRLFFIFIILLGLVGLAAAQDEIKRPQRDDQGQITLSPAIAALIEQAEAGDADAANTVGFQYGNGLSVMQDDAEALKWYRKAAQLGSAEGEYNLGVVYENGFGVKQDYKEAVQWYRKAAERGLAAAQLTLARLYENGQGVPKNLKQAAEWRSKADAQDMNSRDKK
jgi:TPR repeat protein